MTSTFKNLKTVYRNEGIDPQKVNDPLLVIDFDVGTYVPFTATLWNRLCGHEARL